MPCRIALTGCGALLATNLFALGDTAEARHADTPERAQTSAEIVAKPRPKTVKTPVPSDAGIYIGSGVYANTGKMKHPGFCFTYWEPEKLDYDEIIDLCAKEGVGNTLQFWQNNEKLLELSQKAKAHADNLENSNKKLKERAENAENEALKALEDAEKK